MCRTGEVQRTISLAACLPSSGRSRSFASCSRVLDQGLHATADGGRGGIVAGGGGDNEVADLVQHRQPVLHLQPPGLGGILPAEQLLGQSQHHGLLLRRHADDGHDDPQRVRQRDVLHEIALTAHRLHLVDILPGNGLHVGGETLDRAWLEPVAGGIAQFAVLGVIHVDEGFQPVAVYSSPISRSAVYTATPARGTREDNSAGIKRFLAIFDLSVGTVCPASQGRNRTFPVCGYLLNGRFNPRRQGVTLDPLE